jgi:DNA-binding response OmpR family regulator/nitrogen-specific signal transduction histidine kinase
MVFLLRRKLAQAEVIRLQDLDQFKTRIYTNLTHEFRTPLTVISGIADHILSQPSIDNLKDGLPMIKRNSAQLLRLINQMLDLSKLESGRLTTKMIQDNILGYLKYLTESFHSLADSKDIRLHLLPGFEELFMDFDPEKIQAIFSNLVGNAVKFTPPGGNIYIRIERITSGEVEDFLEIKVKDTGKGIPAEHLPYIFDRFYQVDDSDTRSDEGTGIGLALTKELVQLMMGTIEVSSQIGKGSEFTLRLPIYNVAPKGVAGELTHSLGPTAKDLVVASAFGAAEEYDESFPLALLVEDNEDVLTYLELCLQGKYRIQKARNGLQGIQIAIEMIPDIIVSDVMMPEMDGYQLLERLKNDERTSHIPIILLTAKSDLESRLVGLEWGADAYLSKPFEKKELEVRLRKLIEQRQKLAVRYRALNPEGIPETPAEIQEDAFLKKLRAIVEAHLDIEEFGIGELCKELGVSRTQLHRKLKALTDKSTSQVIRTIRMQEAKKLLLNPALNISEIGYAVGYGNPSHFTQEFTKEFGEAPSFFRKG